MDERISDIDMDLLVGGAKESSKIKNLDIPLLSVVKIPNLSIDKLGIDFNMKVKSLDENKKE